MITVRREELAAATSRGLVAALNAELAAQYPEPGATHFRLDEDEVVPGEGAFFVAWRGDEAVGCAALRRHDETTWEIKRMYVAPNARGGGVGARLLRALEDEATRLGARRLVLETGERQLAARKLYERAGFAGIPAFGEYVDSPLSLCMAKPL